MENSYPRVLIISPVKFNQQTGSGVTMGNLFRGWPMDSIAQIHTENWTVADTSVCQQYFYLPYESIRLPSVIATTREIVRQTSRYFFHKQPTLFGHFVHLDDLLKWVREFAPDVIYTRPLDRPSLSIWLPRWLSQQLQIPFITRILDDWPARHEQDPVWLRRFYWRLFLQRNLKELLQQAAANIGISDEMCAAFQERYQAQFIYFHNCVDFEDWYPEKSDYAYKEIFEIVYMGTVKADKELQSLIDLKHVLLNLNAHGHPVRLTLYGPEEYAPTISEHLETHPVIKYGGFFPPEEKFQTLKQVDLLVLPLNFDQRSTTYLGYSFQTKVPEYMASGTPILVYGPVENPNVRYANQHQWAALVDRQDKKLLTDALQRLMTDQNWRQQLGQRARELALQNHNANTIRPQFQQIIWDVVNTRK